MRRVLIATAFAAGAALATTAANAQIMPYDRGGPQKIGDMCKVITDNDGGTERYGYYKPCADQVAGVPSRGSGAAASAPAAVPYYYNGSYAYAAAPAYDGAVAYCIQRFKSYNLASGTYLGHDGKRHPCP